MADDDSWLYGEDNDEEEAAPDEAEVVKEMSQTNDMTPAVNDAAEADDSGSDDDSDDDGIKVTIDKDKIEAAKTSYQNMQLKKGQVIDLGFVPSHKEKKGKFAVEDFDNILTVNGQTAVEVDLESLDDKPWRKPGADITDYFNYGFTEETWAAYCNRQRRMRVNESGVGLALTGQTPILSNTKVTSLGASVLGSTGTIPTLGGGGGTNSSGTSGIQSLGASVTTASNNGAGVDMTKIMSGPPPAASVTAVPTKKDEPSSIAVMTHEKRIYSNKVLSAMDFSVPPPGFSMPPPGIPPPNMENNDFNPSDPFHEYNDQEMGGFEPTASAQWSVPPPAGAGPHPGDHSGPPPGYPPHSGPPPDLRPDGDSSYSDRYRDRDSRDRRDRDRGRDYERSRDYDRDRRRSRSRSRDRRRSRSRDRRRDRSRDRDRDRDRESDRDRKVKKEKRSRSRSRSRSPRHKKSKKDKKERSDREDRESRDTPTKVKEEPKDKE